MNAGFAWVALFVIGSFVGSFLNVCRYRLPREQSVVRPRSRCPQCQHPIAWYDNAPLASYVWLGGRCRHCRVRIPWRYPVVELLAGVGTVAVAARFGLTAVALVYASLIYALIVASFVDLEFQIIPDEISVGGLAAGLVVSALVPALHGTDSPWLALGWSAIGALVGGGVLYVTGMMGDLIFRKESMGGGDVKLLAMAGSLLGWKPALITFFIAPVFAILPGIFVLLFKRSHIIPYGPFLSIAVVVSLFAGDLILQMTGVEDVVRFLWATYGL